MKLLIVCALLPVVFCLPNVLQHLISQEKLNEDAKFLLDKFAGSDLTRQACEAECHKFVTSDQEINFSLGCPLACSALQAELQKFADQHKHSKRSFLGGFNISSIFDFETLKADLQIMLDVLGADPTEQACETECHTLLRQGHTLNYGCPLACKGFQSLVQGLHLKRDTTTVVPPPVTT